VVADPTRRVSSGRFPVRSMLELQASYWDTMERSRLRIEASRATVLGEKKTPIDPDMQGFKDRCFDGPEQQTVPLHLVNKIASRELALVRHPIGTGIQAETTATRLELWGHSAMEELFSRDDAADMLVIEGEMAGIVQLRDAQFGYGKLPELYEYDEAGEEAGYHRRYTRDSKGRSPDEDDYDGAPDGSKTARAYSAAKLDYMARHFPFEVRLLSRLQCVPINPRITGPRRKVTVDGLLVRSQHSRSQLIRDGWRWEGMDDAKMTPSTAEVAPGLALVGGSGGSSLDQVTLYEAWLEDEDGCFAAFCVEGRPTGRRDSGGDEVLVDGVLDLYRDWGLERLPICYGYGLRWAHPNPDLRSIQFPLLLSGMWQAKNAIRTSMTVHTYNTAFMGWAYKPDPEVVRAMADAGLPLTQPIKRMSLIPVAGDLQGLVHPGAGRDALALYRSYEADAQREGPSPAAFGGSESDSAIGQSVMSRDALTALDQCQEGVRRFYEDVASTLLEVGCLVSERFDTPIPIARNQSVPIQQQGARVSPSRAPIVLDPKDAGGVYEYMAEWKRKRGEDLARRQQNVELVKQRLMTTRQFLEEDGDPAPEVTEAAIAAEDLAKTPIVQARRLRLAAQYAADQEQADLLEAMADQTAAPNSTPESPVPMGLLQGVGGPPGMPPEMAPPPGMGPPGMGGGPPPSVPGMGVPNPGLSQLAGIVGAGMQTGPLQNIAAAGGDTSGLPSPPTRPG